MEEDWLIESLVSFANTSLWKTEIFNFFTNYKSIPDDDYILAYHIFYKEKFEPIMNDFLAEQEIERDKIMNLMLSKNKINASFESIILPIFAIYDIAIFKYITNNLQKFTPILHCTDYDNDSDFKQALKLSKEAFEIQNKTEMEAFENDIEKVKKLSKTEYQILQKRYKVEQKLLEKAINISKNEIKFEDSPILIEKSRQTGTYTNNTTESPSVFLDNSVDDIPGPNVLPKNIYNNEYSVDTKYENRNDISHINISPKTTVDSNKIYDGSGYRKLPSLVDNHENYDNFVDHTTQKLSLDELLQRKKYLAERYDKLLLNVQSSEKDGSNSLVVNQANSFGKDENLEILSKQPCISDNFIPDNPFK